MPRFYRARLHLRTGKKEQAAREIRNCIRILDGTASGTVPFSGGMTPAVCMLELQGTLARIA
jgi:chemotaxis protein methyltransferase CheR